MENGHETECNFYTLFADEPRSLVPLPRVFCCSERFIIMEDLTTRSSDVEIVDSLTLAQCESIAEALAKLQARYDAMTPSKRGQLAAFCVQASDDTQKFIESCLGRVGQYGDGELWKQTASTANIKCS